MSEEEPKIYGEGLSPEESREAREYLAEEREEGARPIKGEQKKSREDVRVIGFINNCLKKEFAGLNLEEPDILGPERIHILPDKIYHQQISDAQSEAVYDPQQHSVTISRDAHPRPLLYQVFLHESIHAVSRHSFWADPTVHRFVPLRVGLRTHHVREKEHEHLRGLNEAVSDAFLLELINKHKDEIKDKFGIEVFDSKLLEPFIYADYLGIFQIIVEKIAEDRDENPLKVWQRFKRSMFTGEIIHLRDVDRVFGRGSLRFLAALDSGTKALPREEISEKAKRFFETDDQAEKDKIASEVLNERERLRYFQERKRSAEK